MIELGLGVMGLPPQVFWSMSLKEYKLAQRGFFKNTQRQWEIARYIAFNTLVPHAKKGRLNSPKDLGVFEWEKKDTGFEIDEETKRWWDLKMGMYVDKDGRRYNA